MVATTLPCEIDYESNEETNMAIVFPKSLAVKVVVRFLPSVCTNDRTWVPFLEPCVGLHTRLFLRVSCEHKIMRERIEQYKIRGMLEMG